MENLIARLTKFIDIEYDTENTKTDAIWKLPLEDRIAKGEAIGNLSAHFVGTENGPSMIALKAIFECPDNISKFREGTPVDVSGHGIKFKGEISQESGKKIEVLTDQWSGYAKIPKHLVDSSGWVIDRTKTDIRHILKDPILNLKLQPENLRRIDGILSGTILPGFKESERVSRMQQANGLMLDVSQKTAFAEAMIAENYYLIQGPPGTGKTWVLAYLATELAKEGKNVLVTAFTHTGINNALQKINKVTGYPHTVKMGKSHQLDGLNYDDAIVKTTESNIGSAGYSSSSRGVIVGATAFALSTKRLKGFPFDVLIFDEASQMTVPMAVSAMIAGKKCIFIGDHQQLPPIIDETQTDKELARSIFEHLFQYAPGTMLQTTYRMHQDINAFPSQHFYAGRLKPDASAATRILQYTTAPQTHQDILRTDEPAVFVDLGHTGQGTRSPQEADLIAELVEQLLLSGIKPKDIGILAPFRAQVRLIKAALEQRISDEKTVKKIFVDTVERIQGQERDVVLISLTTSDLKMAAEKAEFFFKPQRLNVAITRAKMKRITLGSSNLFKARSENPDLQKCMDLFRAFYEASKVVRYDTTADIDLF